MQILHSFVVSVMTISQIFYSPEFVNFGLIATFIINVRGLQ